MSLRIRRCLGFANLSIEGPEDQRLNIDLHNFDEFEREESLDEFRVFYQTQQESDLLLLDTLFYQRAKQKGHESLSLCQFTEYDDEFGIPGLILFYPPEIHFSSESEKWYRYNDMIDFLEHKDCIEPTVKPIALDLNTEYLVGSPPPSLYHLITFFDVFKDPYQIWKNLEPVIYTYWA